MYLDTGGNVTVGVGNLLVSANHAAQLGFVRRASLGTATAAEIQADFDNITRQLAGKSAGYYKQFTKLDLPEAVITSLLNQRVTEFTAKLFGAFPDFESYPSQACAAIFDMGFNLGVAGLTAKFPVFCKAVKTRDWETAARECHRAPPINNDRNSWTKTQFEQAAADSGTPAQLPDPATPSI
jgi:GH24 family phage-related lysozyme (muramidase)